MACGDGGWPAVLGESQCQSMDDALPRCQSLIRSCYNYDSVWTCLPASIYCNRQILTPYYQTGQNPYDVRSKCTGNSLCYEQLDWISDWLNKPEVQDSLGVEVDGYDNCKSDVNQNFLFNGDWTKPFHLAVPGILEEIPVLIYAVSTRPSCSNHTQFGSCTHEVDQKL